MTSPVIDLLELQRFAAAANTKLLDGKPPTDTNKLAQLVKLSEEIGELSAAAMLELGYGRQAKLDAYTSQDLAHERADAIITLMTIADRFGIEPQAALSSKIAIIKERMNID